jgi:hypothetical protein
LKRFIGISFKDKQRNENIRKRLVIKTVLNLLRGNKYNGSVIFRECPLILYHIELIMSWQTVSKQKEDQEKDGMMILKIPSNNMV